jgi:hypothetical protein
MQAAAPRGAIWLAEAFHFYSSAITELYNSIFKTVDIKAAQAARLRRFADSIRRDHPGMANDLYAAADRHISD